MTDHQRFDAALTGCTAAEIALRRFITRDRREVLGETSEAEEAIERDEAHIMACMTGSRIDRNSDGTTRCLDLRNEVLCRAAEDYEGMDEAAKRYAARDWQGFADQMRDVFGSAVRAVAVSRLPAHLNEKGE